MGDARGRVRTVSAGSHAGPMQITEYAAHRGKSRARPRASWRGRSRGSAAWRSTRSGTRWTATRGSSSLDAVGSQVLPVLVALPDVEVAPGTRPTYSNQQVQEVVGGLVGDDAGRLQRLVTVKARTALVQTALAHLPPRTKPGAVGPAPR